MGNKNKTINKIKSGEVKIKTRNKTNKAEITNSEVISDFPEPLIKNNVLLNDYQNCTKKDRKNKKLSISTNEEVDESCHGESEENMKNKLEDVDRKIRINEKKKKRNFEDVEPANQDYSKVKKVKSNKDLIKPNDKQLKPKNSVDGASQKSMANKNKQKNLNQDEADVKDEDIDKFCDELTEEDNETYENWVQLFETNFKKKKNSTS